MPSRGLSSRLEQRNMKTLVAAIHGIMTRQTNPSWPDRLDAWFAARSPGMRVLKKEYCAGPWPRWNCAVKNPRLALGLVNEIRLMLDAPGGAEPAPSVWIVAHSNGALVALSAARRLARAGHPVSGLILIGAACAADVRRNGVLGAVISGDLGMAIAYCSKEDGALPRRGDRGWLSRLYDLLAWPYGSLGRSGWMLDNRPLPLRLSPVLRGRILTRWFQGGHSGYFAPDQIEFTFRQIARDIGTDHTQNQQP